MRLTFRRTQSPLDSSVEPDETNSLAARVAMRLRATTWIAAILVTSPAIAERPNILFIMTDDQGAWAAGFAGHPQAHTPRLDRLAAEGAVLANCFSVTPV